MATVVVPLARLVIDVDPRCAGKRKDGTPCRRKLANSMARPWDKRCERCGYRNVRLAEDVR